MRKIKLSVLANEVKELEKKSSNVMVRLKARACALEDCVREGLSEGETVAHDPYFYRRETLLLEKPSYYPEKGKTERCLW